MGCNNTLTNNQLEAMFTATDKEMRKIEQSIEYLTERIKQIQEVYQVLLQWNCTQATPLWTSHQKEKCPHCGNTINCANNLEKLLRSCEKAPKHPAK